MNPIYFLRSQYTPLPYPTKPFTNQTVIVTGSNVGLGFEAARHFVRLNAAKVILAVRTLSKGEEAKKSILASEKDTSTAVEVWSLNLSSHESVKEFARKASQELDRLDVLIQNAGIVTYKYVEAEGNESSITVNVISPFLLSLLLLPKLRETAERFHVQPRLVFVESFVHYNTSFPERKAERIFEELRGREKARMNDRYGDLPFAPSVLFLVGGAECLFYRLGFVCTVRFHTASDDQFDRERLLLIFISRYNVSKLIGILATRQLASLTSASPKGDNIIINCLNPGCKSGPRPLPHPNRSSVHEHRSLNKTQQVSCQPDLSKPLLS